ncbi:mitochondrial carrier protein [Rhizoctonia solani]|uniref:Mitochondrial carrier protein n=1 Tax=Rhizoctonia solani TaxID=456999 RepID=A0A8H8NW06_9AGAM|nr:mitochondrial carrier protein [Rhizoctonia solani]QRW21121.1 mitochondrial carrier protein [Rhizoctonia solani]
MSTKIDSPKPPIVQATMPKKRPYPFWLGGVAASIAASITHPLDLTKVRLQASGDKRIRGLFDGISGTLFRQMTYSLCRFWAYDESKKIVQWPGPNARLENGARWNDGGRNSRSQILMVRMQGDFAKPPEKRLNYKHCFDGLYKMIRDEGPSSLARGMAPNVFRSILMNASQLASYDFFKIQLLQTGKFEDNINLHFTASFMAGTVATTDVLKSRIMNASGPGSNARLPLR